ncbi:hypothetical protein [Agriterribacter sp.]|uniref:hypothetical protein n=1 Tax=Agriterribacter sp. TaxID=2821509 RepID=UPI002CC1A001|nr:hypothetical protein [Agriterribacter sp.]HTN06458.1 hypothetical protein [Agriterribacter sp.]
MRILIASILLFVGFNATTQVIITPQLQRVGILQKQQLWNMVLSNTSAYVVSGHVEVVLGDAVNGQPILVGVARELNVSPGVTQINAAALEPVQYTQVDGNYVIDPGPNGFLPLGNFSVCISFFRHEHGIVSQVAEECDFIEVEPLSPPQLLLPWDEAQETQLNPTFNWLPPAPASFFTNLRYDMDMMEIFPGQSPADAIQQNIPLLHQPEMIATSLLYPVSAPALQYDKQYAWRITAKSNGTVVSRTDVWSFTLKREVDIPRIRTNNLPYSKLVKSDQPAYSLQVDFLKFEYFNEAGDSTWNIAMYDLDDKNLDTIAFQWDSIPLRPGQNLVNIDLGNNPAFTDKHFYLLELINGRNEKWRLRFEFRRAEGIQ